MKEQGPKTKKKKKWKKKR